MTEQLFSCPFKEEDTSPTCVNIPNVAYNQSWHGSTGYIDSVKPQDEVFNIGPVVKFVDDAGRSAIAIKYEISCPGEEKSCVNEYAAVAFQRYTDSPWNWVFGGHYMDYRAIDVGSVKNFTWLANLIQNKHQTFEVYGGKECHISLAEAEDHCSWFKMSSWFDYSCWTN